MYIHDGNLEVENHESTESLDSAQAARTTLRKDWLGINSGDVGVQKNLSKLFSSKEKLEMKAREALKSYAKQGEPMKSDDQADLTRYARFNISPHGTSTETKPRTVPQLNPSPSSGQTSVIRLCLD